MFLAAPGNEIAPWRGFPGQSQLGLKRKRKILMEFLGSVTGSPYGQAQNVIPAPPRIWPSVQQGSRQIHFVNMKQTARIIQGHVTFTVANPWMA
jgi:hypothetical protein